MSRLPETPRPALVVLGCAEGNLHDLCDLIMSHVGYYLLGRFDICGINRAAELVVCQLAYSFPPELLGALHLAKGQCGRPYPASCNRHPGVGHFPLSQAKLRGSSALQAAWLALEEWGYRAVVFAGVGLNGRDCFGGTADYSFFRKHWPAFAAAHGDRARAMSGYPAELLGRPEETWVRKMTREDW